MNLDRSFGGVKRCPVEQARAQVDGGGDQGVNGGAQVDRQRVFGIVTYCTLNQAHGPRRACWNTPYCHVKELGLICGNLTSISCWDSRQVSCTKAIARNKSAQRKVRKLVSPSW